MSEDDAYLVARANDLRRRIADDVATLSGIATRPTEMSEKVRTWRLFTGEEYGGIYCAQPGCGCSGHGSQIIGGAWPAESVEQVESFHLGWLYQAVQMHIEYREEQKRED